MASELPGLSAALDRLGEPVEWALKCPCGTPAPGGICPRCGARWTDAGWRWTAAAAGANDPDPRGRGNGPKTQQTRGAAMADPRKESYTECPTCTREFGKPDDPVIYHYSQLALNEPFWGGEAHWTCPRGHKVEPPAIKKPPAPAS